jgi:hypothetical protein
VVAARDPKEFAHLMFKDPLFGEYLYQCIIMDVLYNYLNYRGESKKSEYWAAQSGWM